MKKKMIAAKIVFESNSPAKNQSLHLTYDPPVIVINTIVEQQIVLKYKLENEPRISGVLSVQIDDERG